MYKAKLFLLTRIHIAVNPEFPLRTGLTAIWIHFALERLVSCRFWIYIAVRPVVKGKPGFTAMWIHFD